MAAVTVPLPLLRRRRPGLSRAQAAISVRDVHGRKRCRTEPVHIYSSPACRLSSIDSCGISNCPSGRSSDASAPWRSPRRRDQSPESIRFKRPSPALHVQARIHGLDIRQPHRDMQSPRRAFRQGRRSLHRCGQSREHQSAQEAPFVSGVIGRGAIYSHGGHELDSPGNLCLGEPTRNRQRRISTRCCMRT